MNKSSIDNIIGLPKNIKSKLSTREKKNIFISIFAIKESIITIFILVKMPKFLFIKLIVSNKLPLQVKYLTRIGFSIFCEGCPDFLKIKF